jgi:hypothetical protein
VPDEDTYVARITETIDWWAMRVWDYANGEGTLPLARLTLQVEDEGGDSWQLNIRPDEAGDIVFNIGDPADEVHVAVYADGRPARSD